MYSFGVAGSMECSKASAGREKRRRHSGPCIRWRSGRIRRGRLGGEPEDEVENVEDVPVEEDEEPDEEDGRER